MASLVDGRSQENVVETVQALLSTDDKNQAEKKRDLPSLQRLNELVSSFTERSRKAVRALLRELASLLLADQRTQWLGMRCQVAGIEWKLKSLPGKLHELAELLRDRPYLFEDVREELGAQFQRSSGVSKGGKPLLAELQASEMAEERLIATVLLEQIGQDDGWSDKQRELLRTLRADTDPMVSRMSYRIFTASERDEEVHW